MKKNENAKGLWRMSSLSISPGWTRPLKLKVTCESFLEKFMTLSSHSAAPLLTRLTRDAERDRAGGEGGWTARAMTQPWRTFLTLSRNLFQVHLVSNSSQKNGKFCHYSHTFLNKLTIQDMAFSFDRYWSSVFNLVQKDWI